jgi:hypothetical protein
MVRNSVEGWAGFIDRSVLITLDASTICQPDFLSKLLSRMSETMSMTRVSLPFTRAIRSTGSLPAQSQHAAVWLTIIDALTVRTVLPVNVPSLGQVHAHCSEIAWRPNTLRVLGVDCSIGRAQSQALRQRSQTSFLITLSHVWVK